MTVNKNGRPKNKRGQKVHTAFKIYADDKKRLIELAERLDVSVSHYVNKAVLERLERDEKLQVKIEAE